MKSFFTAFFFMPILFIESISFADILPDYCSFQNIHSIQVPVSYDNPEYGNFTYKYQLIETGPRTIPVVIYLPGGPGGSGITSEVNSFLAILPQTLPNRVYTDPRSTFCNQSTNTNLALDTSTLAKDIWELLKDLRTLGYTEFILYGHSYGTVQATTIADILSQSDSEEIPKMKALVLEGTIGEVFQKGEEENNFNTILNIILDRGSPQIRQILSSNPLPLDLPNENWANALYSWLYFGITNNKYVPDLLMKMNSVLAEDPNALIAIKNEISSDSTHVVTPIFQKIWCTELGADYGGSKNIINGKLVTSNNICNNIPLSSPYDPSVLKTTVPTIYIHGTLDPATPLNKAQLHFQKFSAPSKQILIVHDAGHMPLGVQLFNCKPQIWSDILKYNKVLDDTIKSCKASIDTFLK